MIYTHVLKIGGSGVRSPIDALAVCHCSCFTRQPDPNRHGGSNAGKAELRDFAVRSGRSAVQGTANILFVDFSGRERPLMAGACPCG
jgi:hypothetical protein